MAPTRVTRHRRILAIADHARGDSTGLPFRLFRCFASASLLPAYRPRTALLLSDISELTPRNHHVCALRAHQQRPDNPPHKHVVVEIEAAVIAGAA
jgi:hypothetical protein